MKQKRSTLASWKKKINTNLEKNVWPYEYKKWLTSLINNQREKLKESSQATLIRNICNEKCTTYIWKKTTTTFVKYNTKKISEKIYCS